MPIKPDSLRQSRKERFMSLYKQSLAYHEAGHITAAVVQKLPLGERGVCIDLEGNGFAQHAMVLPGNPNDNTEEDQEQRRATIITIYAAWAAQRKFYPLCPDTYWRADRDKVWRLLNEIYPADRSARHLAQADLLARAQELVIEYWTILESLAKALLAQPCKPLVLDGLGPEWPKVTYHVRALTGAQLVDFFKGHGIQAKVLIATTGSTLQT